MISFWAKLKLVLVTIVVTLLVTIIYANLRNPQKVINHRILSPFSVSDPRFIESISNLLDPNFTSGNKIETLLNGEQIFPAMLSAIRGAQKTITFESYIYWSGTTGEDFAKALAERSKAGVKVHLLLDWSGSDKISKDLLQLMEKAGVEIERYHAPRWYNITRMDNRTHRKILVVDGKVGFTGGVGIADEWTGAGLDAKHWRDTHYKVQGPVVNQMQSAFMDNWLKTRPEVATDHDYFPVIEKTGPTLAQMFISSAAEGGSSVRIMYLMSLAAAKKTIHLESAYFVPDEYVISQLIEAKKRGVAVQIIVPGPYTDSAIVESASRELWGPLLKAGIQIYQYQPALFHCKVLVIDHEFVSVGSTNFDERSFRLNDEANLNVLDKDFAQAQLAAFSQDLTRSKEVTLSDWENRSFSERFWGKLLTLLDSQL
jgi:cardiolipin synthase